MNVGFIGLGHMGSAMAANIVRDGHKVHVYNRTPGKSSMLAEQGAVLAASVAEVVQADVVFTMLSNDAALEEVVFAEEGLASHLPAGSIHVSSSTISVELSQSLAEMHAARGQGYVAAPVFGRPDAAAAAKIFVVCAGKKDAVDKVTPLLSLIAQRTMVVSEQPPAANLVKLSGNFLVASVIEALGEALALAERAGIDRHRYLEIITSTLFPAPVYNTYGSLIADRNHLPGFGVPLAQKDLRLLLSAAENLNVAMPFASVLRDRFVTLIAQGGESLDWSALGAMAARDAGLL